MAFQKWRDRVDEGIAMRIRTDGNEHRLGLGARQLVIGPTSPAAHPPMTGRME